MQMAETARLGPELLAKLRRVLARVPFAEDLLAAWHCARDRSTPVHVRAVLLGALAYFVLPTDTVADLLPLVGFTDDAAVLLLALRTVGGAVTEAHRAAARQSLDRLAGEPA